MKKKKGGGHRDSAKSNIIKEFSIDLTANSSCCGDYSLVPLWQSVLPNHTLFFGHYPNPADGFRSLSRGLSALWIAA